MMVRVFYLDGEDIVDVYGVIIKAHHYTQAKGVGMTTTRYITRTAFVVFTQRINN